MASLLDIGPLTEEIEVAGVSLTVQGLTAGHLFQLFSEFPDIRKLIAAGSGDVQQIMLGLAPELIAKVIAMATGTPRNKEAEAKAMSMGADDQLSILSAVMRLSFKEGIVPFVNKVTSLMVAAKTETEPAASLPSMTKSPAPFNAALQTDTLGKTLGHARRAN